MFNLDFSEVNSKEHPLSQEERRFMENAKQGIRLCPDGHYEMPLPLKNAEVVLPNNRELALRHLIPLKKRFSSCRSYQDQYTAFLDSMFKNGHAEKVSTPDPTDGSKINSRVWYIPRHGVFHPKKPSMIRVVFDCSAIFKKESLNKHLLQGPDLTNNLCGVLCRFRLESVAFMCHIEAMFYQVRVTKDCRDMLRFLWWENGDTSRQPQEYRKTVHLFGAASSPACSNYALKTTADDNENELGFREEIKVLKANSSPRDHTMQRKSELKLSSALAKLDPFVDPDGILRVGGRLRRARLSCDVKFPAILPKESHVTNLVVKHFHEKVRHQGRGLTLNEIHSNGFWIVGGSSIVRSHLHKCVVCRKLRGTFQEQKMADLSEDRLEPAPPFTNCGVDYIGPWLIKQGRKEVKRYGVLFTCMASRAILLEVSNTLETDSFINALRRFICRRGPI